jgi:hypothetical protein
MKTKREVLKSFALNGSCRGIDCNQCQYDNTKVCDNCSTFTDRLIRIGAMAILRTFPEKREFDPDKILTCLTVDKAKVGMRGYFGDSLASLRDKFERREQTLELVEILNENYAYRFKTSGYFIYALFYPVDEVEE